MMLTLISTTRRPALQVNTIEGRIGLTYPKISSLIPDKDYSVCPSMTTKKILSENVGRCRICGNRLDSDRANYSRSRRRRKKKSSLVDLRITDPFISELGPVISW
jgi:hypothetical protein